MLLYGKYYDFFSPDSTFVLLQAASPRTIVSQVHKSFC